MAAFEHARQEQQQEVWEAGKTAEQLQGSYPTPSLKTWVSAKDGEHAVWVKKTLRWPLWFWLAIMNTVCALQPCQSSWTVDGKESVRLEGEPQRTIRKSRTVFPSTIPSPSLAVRACSASQCISATVRTRALIFPERMMLGKMHPLDCGPWMIAPV